MMNVDADNDLSPILESIAKAAGKGQRDANASQLAIARMTAKLRCVSKDMAQVPISFYERVGREIMAKLPWCCEWNVYNRTYAGRFVTLRDLCELLCLNRPQQTAFKDKLVAASIPTMPYFSARGTFQTQLNLHKTFLVATWYIENHGGFEAFNVRRERHKKRNAKAMYIKMRDRLQTKINWNSNNMKRWSEELELLQPKIAKYESLLADAKKSKQDAEHELARLETEEKERLACKKRRMK